MNIRIFPSVVLAVIVFALIPLVTIEAQSNNAATGKPTISGSTLVTEVLTANTDGISDADGLSNVSYGYQWIRVDVDAATETDIDGATNSTYTTVGDDIGKHIKVRVSFSDDASNSETLVSDQSEMIFSVISFEQDRLTVMEDESVYVVLRTTAAPYDAVSIPHRLMHSYGDASYFKVIPNLTFPVPQFDGGHTEWRINFSTYDDDEYIPDKGNFGVVILKDDFQRDPTTTLPKGFVLGDGDNIDVPIIVAYVEIIEDELDPDANNVATGQPSIQGGLRVGQTLTAEIGTVADGDGVPAESEFSYQWILVDGSTESEISSATTKTYTITASDKGKTLKVRIDFTDDVGYQESVTSAATSEIDPEIPGVPQNLSAEAGNAQVELTWEASTSGGTPSGFEYRFSDDDEATWEDWAEITGSDANTTTYTVGSLTNNTAYTFQVRATNSGGSSSASNSATATPKLPDPPGLLQNLQIVPGDEQVSFSWDPPNSGGEPASYEYRFSTDGGENWSEWTPIPGDASTSNYLLDTLTNNTEYSFQLRGTNAGGGGTANSAVNATPTLPDPPGIVQNLTGTAGDTEVTLEWSTPITGDAPTSYQYRQQAAGDVAYGEWTDIAGSDATTTSHTVTGLQNGLVHSFQVRGVNRGGNGAEDTVTNVTPLPPLPATPSNLTATAGDTKVTLNWDAPTSGGDPSEYAYRQSDDSGATWGEWTTMSGSGATTVSFEVTGLTNGTTYTFEILAANRAGDSDESNQATAQPVPPVPGAPQNLAATAGDAKATLGWDAPNTGGPVVAYQYRYSTDGGTTWIDWTDITGSDSTTVSYTVTELAFGVTHRFEVRATNLGGGGPSSNSATARPTKPGLKVEFDLESDDMSLGHAGWHENPKIVFKFNMSVASFRGFTRSIKITNGMARSLNKQTSTTEPNDWVLEILPFSKADVTVEFVEEISCASGNNAGGICSEDGDLLVQVPAQPFVIEYETRADVVGAWISSDPGIDGEYKTDDEIVATVRFTKQVDVTGGEPTLDLSLDSETRTATWSGGSGTNELTFTYDVVSNDSPVSSISVVDDTLKLAGAKIRTPKRTSADLEFTGSPYIEKVTIDSDYNEDGVWTHDNPSEDIIVDVEFSESVYFAPSSGTPSITIDIDGTEVEATYKSGLGSDTLRFEYDVTSTDGTDEDGTINAVSIVSNSVSANGAGMRDLYGNDADLNHGGGATVWELVPSYGEIVIYTYRLFTGYEAGEVAIHIEVSLSEPVDRVVTVDYATSDDTATVGADYTSVSGTLTFEKGESKKIVSIPVLDDSIDELSELVKLRLSNPTGAKITTRNGTGWIIDDD